MSLEQSPSGGARVALLSGGLVVLMLAVFAGAGILARKADHGTAVASQGPMTPSPTASETPATVAPKVPEVTPSRNPRRQPDVDSGTSVDSGVFVEIAKGWAHAKNGSAGIRATSFERGAVVLFSVGSNPMPSLPLLRTDAMAFADGEGIYGLRTGRVRKLPLPNPNVVEAASVGFTGRRKEGDATYSLGGECVRLRGVPTVNDISLSVCWAAYGQDLDTVRVEVQQMIQSAAGSI
jgi:hypothetical protein